jgi:hypothetical protein
VVVSLAIVFVWVALATYADICFKAAAGAFGADFFLGLLCYTLTGFLALAAFNRQQWGWVFILWNCVSLVLGMVLSVVLFREPFTIKRAAASFFVLIAILLSD